jgi:hypothetical protein
MLRPSYVVGLTRHIPLCESYFRPRSHKVLWADYEFPLNVIRIVCSQCFHVFLLSLFFDIEDGGGMFLRNVG